MTEADDPNTFLPLPAGVVDDLDDIAGRLRRMDDQLGSGTLLHLVRAHLRHVVSLLDQRRYPDSVGRRLHATAGELMRLAGWLSFDSGHHPQAQRYWIAGLHAAHTAGDRALGANIIGFMSAQAIDLGQIRESATLAETARAGYPGATPRVATILDLRAAQAHAYDRSVTECRRALDSAFDRLGDAPSSSGSRAGVTGSMKPKPIPWPVSATWGWRTGAGLADTCTPRCAFEARATAGRARKAASCWPPPTCGGTSPRLTTPSPWPPKRWKPSPGRSTPLPPPAT